MIKLRVVGSSNDLENLILTSRKQGRRGSHVVPIDEKMFRTLEDVVRKRRAKQKGEQPARRVSADSKLAPRDVQRLLRAGKPVEQVAKQAGVDVAWIERFLGPVLDERAVAIRDSQNARLEKPRLGLSSLPLGEAVARNLRARRVRISDDELKAAWDASRSDSQPWVISLTFPYRGKEQRAVWRFDPRTGEVSAGNRLGSDVGWVADSRRPAAPSSASRPRPAAKRPAAKKTAAKKAPARKSAATKRRAAPKRKVAKKTTARRRTPARRRTTTKRRTPAKRRATPKRRTTTKRAAPKRRAPARKAAPKRRAPVKRRTTARRASKRGRR
ncbi:MAG: septation protein SepH [Actinomycetota bacterium]